MAARTAPAQRRNYLGTAQQPLPESHAPSEDGTAELLVALRSNWRVVEHQATADPDQRKDFAKLLAQLASAESRIRQDYAGRYPLELLQNGHDACAEIGLAGAITFWVTPSALLVADQGIGFGPAQVSALTALGQSTYSG